MTKDYLAEYPEGSFIVPCTDFDLDLLLYHRSQLLLDGNTLYSTYLIKGKRLRVWHKNRLVLL